MVIKFGGFDMTLLSIARGLPFGNFGIVGIILVALFFVAVLCSYFSKNEIVLRASFIYIAVISLITTSMIIYLLVTGTPLLDFLYGPGTQP